MLGPGPALRATPRRGLDWWPTVGHGPGCGLGPSRPRSSPAARSSSRGFLVSRGRSSSGTVCDFHRRVEKTRGSGRLGSREACVAAPTGSRPRQPHCTPGSPGSAREALSRDQQGPAPPARHTGASRLLLSSGRIQHSLRPVCRCPSEHLSRPPAPSKGLGRPPPHRCVASAPSPPWTLLP